MRILIFADSHLNHANIATYCDRPAGFTSLIIRRWNERVTAEDLIIHLGDVAIGPRGLVEQQVRALTGRKILIRGNHDKRGSNTWWMSHGFDFSCDAMQLGAYWLTHEPAKSLPAGCDLNIHGHLHNIWEKASPAENQRDYISSKGHLDHPWQRLLSCEYTDYYPIELEEFISHPDKYQARGPRVKKAP